jgi:hypothetical protein
MKVHPQAKDNEEIKALPDKVSIDDALDIFNVDLSDCPAYHGQTHVYSLLSLQHLMDEQKAEREKAQAEADAEAEEQIELMDEEAQEPAEEEEEEVEVDEVKTTKQAKKPAAKPSAAKPKASSAKEPEKKKFTVTKDAKVTNAKSPAKPVKAASSAKPTVASRVLSAKKGNSKFKILINWQVSAPSEKKVFEVQRPHVDMKKTPVKKEAAKPVKAAVKPVSKTATGKTLVPKSVKVAKMRERLETLKDSCNAIIDNSISEAMSNIGQALLCLIEEQESAMNNSD